jgi:lysophospholipase L1-like esterase
MKKISLILISAIIFIYALRQLLLAPNFSGEDFQEDQHSIFAALDPLLGYAHNPHYEQKLSDVGLQLHINEPEYISLKNGFVKMIYKPTENPIKITILGSSSADPYLFNGNWPLVFHKILSKQNIPHIIYNGAVSGYNSTQLLMKLVRDVFVLDKQDYIILYHGGADCIENTDVIVNHPNIHPFSKQIAEQIFKGPPLKDLSLLNRIKSVIFGFKYPIQLGPTNANYIENSIKNTKYMEAVSKINGAQFIHFQEVYSTSESQKIKKQNVSPVSETQDLQIARCLERTHSMLEKISYSFSLQDEVPKNKKIFYDSVHMDIAGSTIIANQIYDKLKAIKILK